MYSSVYCIPEDISYKSTCCPPSESCPWSACPPALLEQTELWLILLFYSRIWGALLNLIESVQINYSAFIKRNKEIKVWGWGRDLAWVTYTLIITPLTLPPPWYYIYTITVLLLLLPLPHTTLRFIHSIYHPTTNHSSIHTYNLIYTCYKCCRKELLFVTKFTIYWHWFFRKHQLIP